MSSPEETYSTPVMVLSQCTWEIEQQGQEVIEMQAHWDSALAKHLVA